MPGGMGLLERRVLLLVRRRALVQVEQNLSADKRDEWDGTAKESGGAECPECEVWLLKSQPLDDTARMMVAGR